MKRHGFTAFIAALCLYIPATAQPLQQIAEDFSKEKALAHALTGISAISCDGDTLVSWNAHQRLVPASNMKLFSTGAALLALGPDYRYSTTLGYSGEIDDGVLHGNLYILGGGDPTLGSKDPCAVPLEKTFASWLQLLKEAGINKIQGYIIGDGSWFEGMMEHGSWGWEDLGTYYGTGVSGLNFYENVLSFNVSHGEAPGSPVTVRQTYPQTSWMKFRYPCTTGEAGTGDKLYLYTTQLSPDAELRGTFAVDRGTKTIDCSNKFPEYTCAVYFKNWIGQRGILCTGGAADLGAVFNKGVMKGEKITIIGKTGSPSLAQIARTTNYKSNNLFAEILFRTLGKVFGRNSSYEESIKVMEDTLKDLMGRQPDELHQTDGSGLSRQNSVSPAFIASYLMALRDTPVWETFLASLPSPASEGTMQFFMDEYPAEMQKRIKLKSGSMTGVRCFSGYILPSTSDKDTITFSIMANNFDAPQSQVQKAIERAIAKLAASN